MKKIIMYNMVSIDGYFAGTNGELDWHNVDEEFNEYAIQFLDTVDTIMLGRITYELFESYWPNALTDPKTSPNERIIAQKINDHHKIIFSETKTDVSWNNSEVLSQINTGEIRKLKTASPSSTTMDSGSATKNIVIYGSGTIVQQLTNLGLIDEYRFIVNPIILGAGKPLFADITGRISLTLLETKKFTSGNVLLTYTLR